MVQVYRNSCPKADALPGCATPRTAGLLGVWGVLSNPKKGNESRSKPIRCYESPEIVPKYVSHLFTSTPPRIPGAPLSITGRART